ncbi:MAG: HdeD family acid-resistance protein [Blastococcus sp.]
MHGGHENGAAAIDAGSDRAHPAETELGRRFSVLLGVRGLLAVIFGVLVLAWPGITVLALAYVFAAYALVDGIGMIISGFGARGGRRWWYVLAGVVGVLAGLATAFWPGVTVLVLVLWAGAWAVVTGVLEIAAAVRREGSSRWLLALVGVLSIVAGLFIFIWPGIGALALATVLGIYALAAGVSLLWAAWQVRRAPVVALGP